MPPLYEFLCRTCGHQFDEMLSYALRETLIDCPHCETQTAEKLFSATAGYKINGDNSASVSPKGAGSFKRSKK